MLTAAQHTRIDALIVEIEEMVSDWCVDNPDQSDDPAVYHDIAQGLMGMEPDEAVTLEVSRRIGVARPFHIDPVWKPKSRDPKLVTDANRERAAINRARYLERSKR